jgi:hypothetical protein
LEHINPKNIPPTVLEDGLEHEETANNIAAEIKKPTPEKKILKSCGQSLHNGFVHFSC